jgi:type II secretory pathway predicted ATPase ExeA
MYLSQYGLKEKPFQISTDPSFLWLGEKHREALATLKYGILHNDGYVLVTGDVGTGKTTLANALIDSLSHQTVYARVADPGVEILDFFRFIAYAYGMDKDFDGKGSFVVHFNSFLRNSFSEGKKVVLIIDEAQRLSPELLEELRHLSNIEENGTRILNLVFVGQNELNDILLEDANRALRQRIAINYDIAPLTEDETRDYISHRLKVAGSEKNIFCSDAIHEIFLFSGGIPRLINIICDLALLSGYLEEAETIEAQIIKECAEQLRLPGEKTESAQQKRESSPERGLENEEDFEEKIELTVDSGVKRKPLRNKMVPVVLFSLVITVLGYVYFSHEKRGNKNESRLKKLNEEVDHENNRNQARNGALKGRGFTATPVTKSSLAPEKLEHSQNQLKYLDSTLEKRDVSTPQEMRNPNVTDGTSMKSEAMNANSIENSPASDKKDFIEFLRKEDRFPEAEKGLAKRENTVLANEDERAIEVNKDSSQDSRRENSEKEDESPDPTEVIDWLLKKDQASR